MTDYSSLKSTIASYLGRSDLTSQIPDFIQLAEERLRRDLRTRQMLVVARADTTSGTETVGLPTDFLEMRDVHLRTTPAKSVSAGLVQANLSSFPPGRALIVSEVTTAGGALSDGKSEIVALFIE